MAKRLVLYDIENVTPFEAARIPSHDPNADVVVAIALSTGCLEVLEEVLEHRCEFEDLLRAGCSAASLVFPGVTRAAMEVALVLPMPEAADIALCRLLSEAGTARTSGEFDQVCLITNDVGLRRSVRQTLRELAGDWDNARVAGNWDSWKRVRRSASLLTRSYSPVGLLDPRDRDDSGPIVVLDRSDVVRTYATHPVQAKGRFSEICAQVEAEPALLTQIGPTRSSLRAIQRLLTLAMGKPCTFSTTDPRDGVEVRHQAAVELPHTPCDLLEASLPAGAVRVEYGAPPKTATLRTDLWASLLRAVVSDRAPPLQAGTWRVDDHAVLARDGTVGPDVQVRFYDAGGDLVCEIESRSPTEPLPCWWYLPNSRHRPNGKLRLRVDKGLLASRTLLDIPARAVVTSRHVVFEGPLRDTVVSVLSAAPAGTLAPVAASNGVRGALLTVRPVVSDQSVRIQAIRVSRAPPSPVLARLWPKLQRLPLVVAVR